MSVQFEGSEKRKHARYPWSAPVQLSSNQTAVEGAIQNISMGGILVTSNLPLTYGEEITAQFAVPKLDDKVSVRCTVRWISGDNVGGFSFIGLKAIETWAISQLVRTLSDESDS